MEDTNPAAKPALPWNAALIAEFDRTARRNRWDLALMAIGWIHLAFFGLQHALVVLGDSHNWHYLALWFAEVAADLIIMRLIAGKGWASSCVMTGLVVRIWATFLILAFVVAMLNAAIGLSEPKWYKNVWTVLSSFGFMMMAYLVSSRFFWLAVQMALTGLIISQLPDEAFLIYGASWCLALQIIGLTLRLRWSQQARTASAGRENGDLKRVGAEKFAALL